MVEIHRALQAAGDAATYFECRRALGFLVITGVVERRYEFGCRHPYRLRRDDS
jgi:hypothetical protein